MGRTYRYEKEWGRPRKKNKRGKKPKPLQNNKPHDEIDEDEQEVTAYEEEVYKRYSNKPVKGF